MTSAQVVETSVTYNSSFKNYLHPDDHTIRTTDTPGFKPFTTGNTDLYFPSSRLVNSGVTLAIFHSFGKVSASIQLLKMHAKEGPTIRLESFKSLQGILSNPVVSSWFKSLHTVLALGALVSDKPVYQD